MRDRIRVMVNAAHLVLFSTDAEADRMFLRDVLGFKHVDAGHGWLIFALPPAEVAVHPTDDPKHKGGPGHAMLGAHLYLMCEDLEKTIAELKAKKVSCGTIAKERWGARTTIQLPSGGEIGLYQPSHPTAIGVKSK